METPGGSAFDWNGSLAGNLDRNPHRRAQPTHRAVAERDVAAMGAGDVAGNRQPKPGAAFVLVARIVEPQERLEHLFAHARRNAGAVVVDGDGEIAGIPVAFDSNGVAMARRGV